MITFKFDFLLRSRSLQRSKLHLLDHLVGGHLNRHRHVEVKRLCGPEVEHELEFGVDFAARYRLPAVYWDSRFVKSGGLMSYASNLDEQVRHGAAYVDRILKGEKPGDLPVQETAKFDLVINLNTAKTIGLQMSPTLLARADEIID